MFFLEYRCQLLLPLQGVPVSAYPYIAYKLIMKETGFQRLCGPRTSCLEALLRAENGAFYSESVCTTLISLHCTTRRIRKNETCCKLDIRDVRWGFCWHKMYFGIVQKLQSQVGPFPRNLRELCDGGRRSCIARGEAQVFRIVTDTGPSELEYYGSLRGPASALRLPLAVAEIAKIFPKNGFAFRHSFTINHHLLSSTLS